MTEPDESRQPPGADEQRVVILGSTGSIGTQTIRVIEHLNALHRRGEYPRAVRVVGLAAGNNAAELARQARELGVERVALANAGPSSRAAWTGPDAAERLVREVECDIVVGAMVGSAGLPATLAAIELGRDVALANKETLVAAGELVVPAARASGSRLLPVDSEHAGLWQCLLGRGCAGADDCPPLECSAAVARLVLTASGGPFLFMERHEVYNATPEQALKHPRWKMGPKVTVDSASLTNKALEVIEAHWLFGVPGDRIAAVVHPQSIVHAMVEFADGSAVAQLAAPDMCLPIQAALAHPHQPRGISPRMNLMALGGLEFIAPDLDRFPALALGHEVIRRGGTSGAVFNAANEAAVELFLAGSVPFGRIPELARHALDEVGVSPIRSLGDVLEADRAARLSVTRRVGDCARV